MSMKGELYRTVEYRRAICMAANDILMTPHVNPSTVDVLLKTVHNEAIKNNRQDVLEALEFAGLIYG